MSSHLQRAALALLLLHLACTSAALAQGFPSRPIRLVVPYGPGASTDTMARLVGQKVSEDLKQPVIIENRAGASGMIGADFVARAAPDGYTILLATDATHSGNVHLMKAPPFHPLRDSTPITMAAKNILVLAANPAFSPNTIAELIDYAKKNPGKLSYGSSGSGSPHHLAGVLLNQMAGIDLMHVAYKGGAPAITDVLGGQLPLVFSSMVAVTAQIKAGKLKALGITEKTGVAAMPGVPPIADTIADFEMQSWLAFVGPAGLPPAVLQTLNQSITKALKAPDVAAKLGDGGLLVVANTPEQFAVQLKADFEKRGELIRRNNITE